MNSIDFTKLHTLTMLFPLKGEVTQEMLRSADHFVRNSSVECLGVQTLENALEKKGFLVTSPDVIGWVSVMGSMFIRTSDDRVVEFLISTVEKLDFMTCYKPCIITFFIFKVIRKDETLKHKFESKLSEFLSWIKDRISGK